MPDIEILCRAGALNGEGPVWSAQEERLYWVDIRAPALHSFDPATGRDRSWAMPAWTGCLALGERGPVLALRTGLFRFDTETGALEFLAPPPFDPRRFSFNDGGCDRQGRFLAGTMYAPLEPGDEAPDAPRGSPLWRYEGADGWRGVTPPVETSNGLAFSPDGRVMYHSDTAQKTVWRYDYDARTGTAENRRVFARVDVGAGPDGAAVDSEGFYLCAAFGGGCLLRFDPDGRLERRIDMPARFVTMPAFGGADLGRLFVTSASFPVPAAERADHPNEGALFALEAPAPGLATHPIALPPAR